MFWLLCLITQCNVTSWSLIVSVTITYSWLSVCFCKINNVYVHVQISPANLTKLKVPWKQHKKKLWNYKKYLLQRKFCSLNWHFDRICMHWYLYKFNQNFKKCRLINHIIYLHIIYISDKFLRQNCRRKWLRTC